MPTGTPGAVAPHARTLDATADDYDTLIDRFTWRIPERFNIGVAVCDRHASHPVRANYPALIEEDGLGRSCAFTFARLKTESDRMANAFAALGVGRGDRVAILLPQRPETALAHIAVYKLGAIAVPLFTLFGSDALAYRLADSGSRVVVTDRINARRILDGLPGLDDPPRVICVDNVTAPPGALRLDDLLARASPRFVPADTAVDDPALIIYTSGTTGKPKGALHAHRVLLGHLPGVEMPHNFFPQPDDLFWTPADWAWIGGLLDVLLPSLYHGVPVLAHRAAKFDPEEAVELMERHRVRNVFMPPTALRLLRQVPESALRGSVGLRSLGSGGETLGADLLAWGRDVLGVQITEFYGQTECNLIVANCPDLFAPRPGSMGRPVPGHRVAVIDDAGQPQPPGVLGHIAVARPDPVMFLSYWNAPQATADKFIGDWLITGDLGRQDEDGFVWYTGREDDIITSAGYRIGPGEVEEALQQHPAVAMAAVVGLPDADRTEVVAAFVVPRDRALLNDAAAQSDMAKDLQRFVKDHYAAHAYPRRVTFLAELPMTTTGKVRRKDLREGTFADPVG